MLLRTLSRLAVVGVLMLGARSASADLLFFQATNDPQGHLNYNWFTIANWYFKDAQSHLQPANKIAAVGDEVTLLSAVQVPGAAHVAQLDCNNQTVNQVVTSGNIRADTLIVRNNGTPDGTFLGPSTYHVTNHLYIVGGNTFYGGSLN